MKKILQRPLIWLMLLAGFSTGPLLAQNGVQVRGTVVEKATGEPFPGVTVLEKGTTNGTVTDIDGNFSIQVSSENSVLSVSFIGFLNTEIPVAGRSNILIELEEDLSDLEEVVVIGYQTVKKKT